MKEKSKEDQIADAMRIENFKKDEVIDAAIGRLERRYYEEFKTSKDSEGRVRAWAKARVLDDFLNELSAVVGAGEKAKIDLAALNKRHNAR